MYAAFLSAFSVFLQGIFSFHALEERPKFRQNCVESCGILWKCVEQYTTFWCVRDKLDEYEFPARCCKKRN